MLAAFSDSTMWVALLQIVIINILLSGDNAVIIALACRNLEPKQQRNAFLIGTVAVSYTHLTLPTTPYV